MEQMISIVISYTTFQEMCSVFDRKVPNIQRKLRNVCSSTFSRALLSKFNSKTEGLATKLILKPNTVPCILPGNTMSMSLHEPMVHFVVGLSIA